MIRIAIIGDIGSGKTYIAKLFGYPVFNADLQVSKIYKENRSCFDKLKKILPNYIFSFPIKKKELIKAIMANENNLKKIVKIVHPKVRLKMNKFINKNKNKKFIILDIPLLLENKLNKKNDILIYVSSTKANIKKILRKRLNFNLTIFKKLKKIQLPVEFKKKKCDYIIKNNFKRDYVKKNVKIILKNILLNA